MRTPLALVAALVLATSLAAGCGDDGDDEETSTSIESGSDADSGDDADTGDSTTTTAGTEGTGDTTAAGANPDSDFCQAANDFVTDPTIADLDFTKPEDVARGVELLTTLRDAAPADLQDDLDIVIAGFEVVAERMAAAGDDPAAQREAVAALDAEFAEMGDATTNVQTYVVEQCGVDMSGSGGASG